LASESLLLEIHLNLFYWIHFDSIHHDRHVLFFLTDFDGDDKLGAIDTQTFLFFLYVLEQFLESGEELELKHLLMIEGDR